MYLLGYDIGSSSVKASLVDVATGDCVASAFAPAEEAPIFSQQSGWAEQDPQSWWQYLKAATAAFEADIISQALAASGGNMAAAARALGSTPRIVAYKARKYNLKQKTEKR